jgi:hypothetical protein
VIVRTGPEPKTGSRYGLARAYGACGPPRGSMRSPATALTPCRRTCRPRRPEPCEGTSSRGSRRHSTESRRSREPSDSAESRRIGTQRPVADWNRQAGGHWFEPSIAHLGKPRPGAVFARWGTPPGGAAVLEVKHPLNLVPVQLSPARRRSRSSEHTAGDANVEGVGRTPARPPLCRFGGDRTSFGESRVERQRPVCAKKIDPLAMDPGSVGPTAELENLRLPCQRGFRDRNQAATSRSRRSCTRSSRGRSALVLGGIAGAGIARFGLGGSARRDE